MLRGYLAWYILLSLLRVLFYLALLQFDFKLSASQGLVRYKSWPHLPKGLEGVAWQVALKEVADGRKKKRTEKARRRHRKE